MPVGAPRVETEQDRSIRVEDLPEVIVGRSGLREAKQRLVPFEAPGHVSNTNDRPRALHGFLRGLTLTRSIADRCQVKADRGTRLKAPLTISVTDISCSHAQAETVTAADTRRVPHSARLVRQGAPRLRHHAAGQRGLGRFGENGPGNAVRLARPHDRGGSGCPGQYAGPAPDLLQAHGAWPNDVARGNGAAVARGPRRAPPVGEHVTP